MDDIIDIGNELEALEVSKAISSPEDCLMHLGARSCSRKSLTILLINIRSINCNFDALCVFLQRINFQCDLIVLTECWLSKVTNELPTLQCYTRVNQKILGINIKKCKDLNNNILFFYIISLQCNAFRITRF